MLPSNCAASSLSRPACEGISQHTNNKKKQTADKLHTRKLWRCHGDGGRTRPFCMQWRIHASRNKILCKRAEERRMAASSVPTIHDTWARRVWYPPPNQGGTPERIRE